jgi:hypothetical protein
MRSTLALLSLAQALVILAVPVKLAGRNAYWDDPDAPARYLA